MVSATYVADAPGVGVIILVLSVASALARSTVANHMRRLLRVAPRIGGAQVIAVDSSTNRNQHSGSTS